ncbi:MAG: hypothetical protein RI907_1942 [Pseudomonadota bacterium]|jgi:glutaredoxin
MNAPQASWLARLKPFTGLLLLVGAISGGSLWMQASRDRALGESLRQAQPQGRITLYTTLTCVYCTRAKDWLRSQQVPFEECRVDTDAACAATYRKLGEPGTPVVQVDADQFHLGFDPDWLHKALAQPRH